ncbi:protein NLRC3-like [Silurus meridionalis]|nr:protein NLRC3-like [Silurus meridionalis]
MKSDESMDPPRNFSTENPSPGPSKLQRKRSHSPQPTMKSDESMDPPRNFSNENPSPGPRSRIFYSKLQREKSHSAQPSCVSMKSDESMDPPRNFRTEISSPVHSVLQKAGDRREKNIITATGHDPESTAADEFQKKLKFNLMEKFQCLNELMLKQENRTLLNEIYTELYITEGDSGDVNKEHEIQHQLLHARAFKHSRRSSVHTLHEVDPIGTGTSLDGSGCLRASTSLKVHNLREVDWSWRNLRKPRDGERKRSSGEELT